MTEVAFHFNVPDKLPYACRLLRKVYQSGHRVRVVADAETLATLDQALWTFSARDFIPHCHAGASAALLAHSPIVLAASAQTEVAGSVGAEDCVLLNLGEAAPEGYDRYPRLIELVSQSAADRAAARQRWRHYAGGGHPITRHDLAAPRDADH